MKPIWNKNHKSKRAESHNGSFDKIHTRRSFLGYGLLAASMLSVSGLSQAQGKSTPEFGPINPAYVAQHKAEAFGAGVNTPLFGLRHSPLDLSHLTGQSVFGDKSFAETLLSLPPTYDLRTLNRVTPVEDQGQAGTCWTFAAMGSLESNLMPSQTCSFSENNLKDTSGFDLGWNGGGNRDMATAYFARWSGPVNTSDDPYSATSGTSPSNLAPRKHVQEVLFLPDRSTPTDNETIKQAVMNYGGVMSCLYMDYGALSKDGTTYYNSGGSSTNHAVVIVGWDDNFDKSKFASPAPGNGAFICRNSWGASFGQKGYFYISYYDKWIGKDGGNTVFNNAEDASNYTQVYQYDPLGCVSNVGYSGKTQMAFANVFSASSSDSVAAVSFYTLAPNTTYTMSLYANASDGPVPAGTATFSQNGSIATPGYHTVPLSTVFPLTSGQKFSVVISVSANSSHLIPVEAPFAGYSSKAAASPGQSYVSADGKTWTDVTTFAPNTNVCIKAFTKASSVVTTPVVTTLSVSNATASLGQTVSLSATLQRTSPTGALSGKTLSFALNGSVVGTGVTNSSGVATCSVKLPSTGQAGTQTIVGTYAGESGFKPASGSGTLTVTRLGTKIAAQSVTGHPGDKVSMVAVLTRTSDNSVLGSKTLTFTLNKSTLGTATTDSTGKATFSYTIPTNASIGASTYTVSFAADATNDTSSASATYTVTKK